MNRGNVLRDIVEAIASEAGALALTHFRQLAGDEIAEKGPLDLVTIADRAVEALIVQRLRAAFPLDGILGEEGGAIAGQSGRVWVIDPIDGTFNFVRGGAQWSVSIGLYERGAPGFGVVFAPVSGQLVSGGTEVVPQLNGVELPPLGPWHRERAACGIGLGGGVPLPERLAMLTFMASHSGVKLRCCNCATAAMLELISGEADGYLGLGESAWDVMGIWPVLTALGAQSSLDWRRVELGAKLRFVIGKPELIGQLSGLRLAVDGSG